MQSWFSWKGERSIDKGIWVTTLPGLARAEERNEQIEVAGRPGVLTILNGEDNHEPITLTVVVTAPRNINLQPVLDWLTGGGDVVFSNQPDRAYEAQILDSVEFMNISNTLCQANVNFICQPHKKAVPKEGTISKTLVADTAQTIVNPGTVAARPKVKVTKSAAGNITLSVGNGIMSFTNAPEEMVIDCDAEIILSDDYSYYAEQIQQKYFTLGNVNLLTRPQVPVSVLVNAGWDISDTGTATLYTSYYLAGNQGVSWNQNIIIHITPIKADGTVLSPSDLDTYVGTLLNKNTVQKVLNADKESYGLVLWIQTDITDWDSATETADSFDNILHLLQEAYYLKEYSDFPTNEELQELNPSISYPSDDIKKRLALWTGTFSGDFFRIPKGSCEIESDTACSVEIEPNWRWK